MQHERHAIGLERRFEEMQRVDRKKAAEIVLARQQQDRDVQEVSTRKTAQAVLQKAHQASLIAQAEQTSERARLEERCLQ
jgi:hypothetical protein